MTDREQPTMTRFRPHDQGKPAYYTPMELEELYGVSAVAWRRWAYRGSCRSIKARGKIVLIPREEVDRVLAKRQRVLAKRQPLASLYEDFKMTR